MSLGATQTTFACTLGADNNCSGQGEPDATTTVVRARPNTNIGNPISLITGNKYQRETDFKLTDSRLAFHRHYNSRNTDFNFGFGRGWTTTYSANLKRIINSDNGQISGYEIVQGNGRLLQFQTRDTIDSSAVTFRGARPSDGYIVEQGERYLWVMPDGRRLTFHGSYLIKIDFPGNEFLTLHYRHKRVISVTDQANRVLRFEYTNGHGGLTHYEQSQFQESPGHLARLILPDGSALEYDYDSQLNLSRVRYSDGTEKQFHYEDDAYLNHLTGITDRNRHRFATWNYNADGRAISSEHADGVERITIDYDVPVDEHDIGTTRVTNSLGEVSTYTWQALLSQDETLLLSSEGPGCATCPVTGMRYEYNDRFDLVSVINQSYARIDYEYDYARRIISKTQRTATGVARITNRYAYDRDNAQPTLVARPSVNPAGEHITEFTYNADGVPTSVTERGFSPRDLNASEFDAIERTTTFEYEDGRLLAIDGPRTDVDDVTRFSHDAFHRLQSVTRPSGITTTLSEFNERGQATVFQTGTESPLRITYDNAGNILRIASRGREIQYQYNAEGKLVSLTTPDGKTSSLRYDSAGRLTEVEDDLGRITSLLRDSESRLINKTDFAMNGDVFRSLQIVYDAAGRLQSETTSQANPTSGELFDQTATFELDENGRPQAIQHSSTTQTLSYGVFGELLSIEDSFGTRVQAHYDNKGQDTGQTDARLNTTRYLKDDFGRIVIHHSPDTGLVRYTYDSAGNRIQKIAADRSETRYRWDAASRLIWQQNSDGITSYDYSEANGLLTIIDFPEGAERYSYDKDGQLTEHTREIDVKAFTTTYAYTVSGKLHQKTLPDGQTLRYHYYEDGINKGTLRAITRTALFGLRQETLLAEIDIDSRDGTSGYLSHNGIRTERHFSPDGRVTDINIDPALKLSYRYDNYGRIIGINENSIEQQFSYDRERLASVSSPSGDYQYSYDSVGNRLQSRSSHGNEVNSTEFHYPLPGDGNRLLLSTDHNSGISAEQQFNEAGSPEVTISGLRYEYNAEQRPLRVFSDDTLVAEYTYNSFGQRIRKVSYDQGQRRVTYFLYDGHTLTAEIDGETGVMRQSVFLNHQPVVRLDNGTPYAIHGDHLGTPRLITNDDQSIVWKADYSPTGAASLDVAEISFNHRRPGQYHDTETGTLYNYLRDYDPATGRYLTSDPIGLQGGMNTYTYADNDLLGSADVLGLDVISGSALMGLQSRAGSLNPSSLNSNTGFGVSNPSDVSVPNPADNDAIENEQLVQQFNVVVFDDCSDVIGDAIDIEGTGTALLIRQNLTNINYHVSHDPEGMLDYEININTYHDGFSNTQIDLSGEQIVELHEGTSQFPTSRDHLFILTIAEGTTCEEIANTVRRTVGNLLTESDLNALYASLPLDDNCTMTSAALLDLTPLFEEMLVRFQTNMMTDQRVVDANLAFIDATYALEQHLLIHGENPCAYLPGLDTYDQGPCDERRALEAEVTRSYQVLLDTVGNVHEEMVGAGNLPPYAVQQIANDAVNQNFYFLAQVSQVLLVGAAIEAVAARLLSAAVMSTSIGRALAARISQAGATTGVAISTLAGRVAAAASVRINAALMLRYRNYQSFADLDYVAVRRLQLRLGNDGLHRLDGQLTTLQSNGARIASSGDDIVLTGSNGTSIGRVRNGQVVPDNYVRARNRDGNIIRRDGEVVHGESIDGYQLVSYRENGQEVFGYRRVPSTDGISGSSVDRLTSHPTAHTLERHGPDVSNEALIRRANEGRAPDGSPFGVANPRIEPMSSRFDSPEQLETALQNTGPGTPAFNRVTPNSNTPNRMTVIHQLPPGETYGSGVPAGGSNLVQLQSVTVKYERIDGVWHVASMYPS